MKGFIIRKWWCSVNGEVKHKNLVSNRLIRLKLPLSKASGCYVQLMLKIISNLNITIQIWEKIERATITNA